MAQSHHSLSYHQRFIVGFITVLFASALTACGGGSSGGGGGSAATYKGLNNDTYVYEGNYEALAEAAIEGSLVAINEDGPSDDLPDTVLGAKIATTQVTLSDANREWLAAVHQQVLEQANLLPETSSAANVKVLGECGGFVTVGTNGRYDGEVVIRQTFNDYCLSEPSEDITLNGTFDRVTYFSSGAGPTTSYQYQNFTIHSSTSGKTHRINNTTILCVDVDGNPPECQTSSDFVGTNGIVYRMNAIDVTDNDPSYDIYAILFHPEYGGVQFNAESLVACPAGGFESGTIKVYSQFSNSEAKVTFGGCGTEDKPEILYTPPVT